MKVFQCLHKYPPHIPVFEKNNNIESSDLSFNELRDLVIKDGYASTYILKPALEGHHEQVFYTIWDYERLQYKWAEENGLKTRNLDEIKLAQIEEFNPDVFYNHSPRYDNDFVKKLSNRRNLKKVCWDAIITKYPSLHEWYNLRLTLFYPFVKYWLSRNLASDILQPAYSPIWNNYSNQERIIDILFYGQFAPFYFDTRSKLVTELIGWSLKSDFKMHFHLDFNLDYFLREKHYKLLGKTFYTKRFSDIPKVVLKNSLPPVYGSDLYSVIAKSKIVINAFTDNNGLFTDNMRTYESIGLGALMIGEDGIYPDFLEPDRDFLTYKSLDELIEKIEYALSLSDQGREMAIRAQQKLINTCSKEKQWNRFCQLVENV
ncbi:MAG: glycosyltransferase [Prolixibacteraceae bacterium]|nr:glycosyltransferase [Prolixibacteraceae bacterium]